MSQLNPLPGPEDLEVLRLNLAQVAAAPDTWRARAVAAGGFFGAAAAVSILGMSQQAERFDGCVVWVAGVAALFYVIAVVGFLVAGVLPTPKLDSDATGSIADQMHAFAQKESKPIKRLVIWSAVFGSAAIAMTTLSTFLVLFHPMYLRAELTVTDDNIRASLERVCPGLPDPFSASVTNDGSDFLRVRVVGDSCGSRDPELTLPRSSVLLKKF